MTTVQTLDPEQVFNQKLKELGLVKKIVITFDLACEYQGAKYDQIVIGDTIIETARLDKDWAKEARKFRTKFYYYLRKFAYRTELGWVLRYGLDPTVVEIFRKLAIEYENLCKNFKKRGRKIRIFEIFVPKDYLVEVVSEKLEILKKDKEDISVKILDKSLSEKERKQLKSKLDEIEKEIENLLKELEYLQSQ